MIESDGFCGDPLWNDFKPAYNRTSLPLPTECFSHTVLIAVPCLFFWIQVPILLIQVNVSKKFPLPWTTLQGLKWLVSTIIICDMGFLLFLGLWDRFFSHKIVPLVELVFPSVMIITMLAILLAMNEFRRAGIRSSGSLFVTWLIFVICGTPEFVAWITMGSDPEIVPHLDFFRYVSFLVYYPMLIIQLILHLFADPINFFIQDENDCPEETASFLNRVTLWWMNPIISKGKRKPLEVDDLFELDEEMQPDVLIEAWKQEWGKSLQEFDVRKRAYQITKRELAANDHLLGEKKKGYGTTDDGKLNKGPTDEEVPLPSIIKSLWPMFKWNLLGSSVLKLFADLLQYANPTFLDRLISFTEDANAFWYEGLAYAILLFVCAQIRSLFVQSYNYSNIRIGNQIQTVLTSAVYEKTLRLSNASRRMKTHGEIVNLMAIDVERFKMITPQLQQFWSSPMQIVICMVLLYNVIGYSVFAGVIVMLVLIPANYKVSSISKRWTLQQMKLKDERIRLTNEILNGVKVVKLYAWEPALEEAVDKIRREEMSLVKKAAFVKTAADMLNIAAPFFVALASFTTYTMSNPLNVITPQVAFVSITLFNQLRGPLLMAADLIQQTIQCVVSNKRLKEFLVAAELRPEEVDRQRRADLYDKALEMDGAAFTWDESAPTQLQNLSFHVDRSQLVAVVGTVASGKSSLLSALLGEMEKLRGYIGIRGLAAYIPQQPWIQNKSLRDNILMDLPYNKVVYDQVIEACALKDDLDKLPSGDFTEIGEKGINLSGGQKARVSLARAVYQDRDIYLLDDPLSAVDAHVARHIFQHVIGPNGLLSKKTRILVTHGLSFLKDCDKVAVMNGGTITHIDTYDNLLEDESITQILKEAELENNEDQTPSDSSGSVEHVAADDEEDDEDIKSQTSRVSRKSSRKLTKSNLLKGVEGQKLIEKETAETGRVKPTVYMDYFNAMGIFQYLIPYVVTMILTSVFGMGRALWLTDWSNDNTPIANGTAPMPVGYRLAGFSVFGISEVGFMVISMMIIIAGGVKASLKLHKPLLHNIMRSPLSYFDITPLGRILNRLGKDIETVDLRLSSNFRFMAVAFINVAQTCIIVSLSTPLFIAFIIPVFIIYLIVLRHFISSSRQLQRLASLNRSPIYSHFGETIQGASTIRAYGWVNNFIEESKLKLHTFTRCAYFSMVSACWLGIRLEMLGNTLILATALLSVWSKYTNSMDAGFIGLSVSYSLSITFMMNLFIRQLSEIESNVVSVERIKEYTNTATEAEWKSERPLPVGWPAKGRIVFRDYSTRYRPGLDLVLRGLNLNITPGEKVGVVGRTGAGKSSLALALFRIVEPAGGQIILDDIDISTIGLHNLRENLTIIPQDPVLFSGTLRFNLDPVGEYDDSDLWNALDHSNMKEAVEQLPMGLDHRIEESGENISVGQRQLVCLTRALLRKSRVLVLDEATAAVDVHTDSLIQTTIRREFSSSTVITIAHRLNTIMDYDKVLVMDVGRVAEYDSPQNLLLNKKSIFYSMAQSAKLI